MEGIRNMYEMLVRKVAWEEKGLGNFRHGWEYNIKIDLGFGETTAYIWHKSSCSDWLL